MRADGFVWDVASSALQAVVDTDVTGGAEPFVVIRRDVQRRAKLLVELAKVSQFRDDGGQFAAVASDEEFLVAGVPEMSELAVLHDGGKLRHLVRIAGELAELGAAVIFLDARHAAGTAHGETMTRKDRFDFIGLEFLVHVPHDYNRVRISAGNCKAKNSRGEKGQLRPWQCVPC